MCEKQQGATLTFGTSGGTWEVISIGRFGAPIPVIDGTHLGTTGFRGKCAGQLQDPQMVPVVVRNKGNLAYPLKGLVQLVTVTAPLSGYTTAEKPVAGSAFVVDVRTPEFQSDSEALQTVEMDIMFTGGHNGTTAPARTLAIP